MNIIRVSEACSLCGVTEEMIQHFIQEEWIVPADPIQVFLDEEDLARIRLIRELMEDLGVNDEAVPIILHLVDQLNLIQSKIRSFS